MAMQKIPKKTSKKKVKQTSKKKAKPRNHDQEELDNKDTVNTFNKYSDYEGRRIMINPFAKKGVSNPEVLRRYGEARVQGPETYRDPYTSNFYPTGMNTRDVYGEKAGQSNFRKPVSLTKNESNDGRLKNSKPWFTRPDATKKSQQRAQQRANNKKKK